MGYAIFLFPVGDHVVGVLVDGVVVDIDVVIVVVVDVVVGVGHSVQGEQDESHEVEGIKPEVSHTALLKNES